MKKILFILMLVSTRAEAKDIIGDMLRIYAPQPQVVYVIPLNNGYAPQPIAPSISPSTYVAPSNTWTPIVTPTPTIDLSPNK
jgi:hypothetical protein